MRIVVNDIAASQGGAISILKDFYEVVKEYDKENEYYFLLSDNYIEETSNIKVILLPNVKKSRVRKLLFDVLCGRKFVRNLKPDVVFSLQNIITFGLHVPQITYIHQSVPYQKMSSFSFFKHEERGLAIIQYVIGRIISLSAQKADNIIVQTNWMKSAIIEKDKISDGKIHVIPPDIKFDKPSVPDGELDRKQFFYPTSPVLYKNNHLIVDACSILDKAECDYSVELTLSDINAESEHILAVGRMDRAHVWKSYFSKTLLFPSYIETYGMPLAEARKAGTIILVADCVYAREVLAGYDNAYFFDYRDAVQLADLMKKVIDGEIMKKVCISNETDNETDSWLKVIELLHKCSCS